MKATDPTPEAWEQCLQLLQLVSHDPSLIDNKPAFKTLIAKLYRHGRKQAQQQKRQRQQTEDKQKRAKVIQQRPSFATVDYLPVKTEAPADQSLQKPTPCYICKNPYQLLHFFYHKLCPTCAALNFRKRYQRANLDGYRVLITGGRIKIGYQTALRCLRDGATVYVTTRFPEDAYQRYQQEADFPTWASRLHLYGLDLRKVMNLAQFIDYMEREVPYLDILINNAAQTIKRPLQFYAHLLEQTLPVTPNQLLVQPKIDLLEWGTSPVEQEELSAYFPENQWDADGQPLDKRVANSWSATLADVDLRELVEVQLVNAIAPFILCSQLKPHFLRSPHKRRFIVNVSAMEGQFGRKNKTYYHPHTNMAKASLNMLTRTSAEDYVRDNIYMNSVDTGWITDENPFPKQTRLRENGFYPPLDVIDGCARILDPVYTGISQDNEPLYGHFLKDYDPYPW